MDYATYSPHDNKLRMYLSARLDEETYQRARAVGFRWAPKQELFVCPRWTPAAEDFALELCGEIGDEDTTPEERAEERAERFDGYRENRTRDANAAADAVEALAGSIPLGQPILVGHHSEKRARKDAERIRNGMAKAVRMWDTAKYWVRRAEGSRSHARYVETVPVRLRRIKRLEAERRKRIAYYTPNPKAGTVMQERWYSKCQECGSIRHKDGPCIVERGHDFVSPPPEPHVWCGHSVGGTWVPVADLEHVEKGQARDVAHLGMRLEYERAMLGDYVEPAKPKRPKLPPLLNYRAESVQVVTRWSREPETCTVVEMTKAEYKAIYHESRWTLTSADGSHRVRIRTCGTSGGRYTVVFLTDSKAHPVPEAVTA